MCTVGLRQKKIPKSEFVFFQMPIYPIIENLNFAG